MQLTNERLQRNKFIPAIRRKIKARSHGNFSLPFKSLRRPGSSFKSLLPPGSRRCAQIRGRMPSSQANTPDQKPLEVLMDPRSFPFNKLTPADHLTIRKWKWGVGAVYGAALLVLVLIVAAGPYTKTETASIEHGFSGATIADPHTNQAGSSGYSYRERK